MTYNVFSGTLNPAQSISPGLENSQNTVLQGRVFVCGFSSNSTVVGDGPNGNYFGASRHSKDVPFVRDFWSGTYGSGAISPRRTPIFTLGAVKYASLNISVTKYCICIRHVVQLL